MNAYKAYFDRQGVSPGLHDKLVALGNVSAQKAPFPLQNPEENEPPARIEMPLQRDLLAPTQSTPTSTEKGAFGLARNWHSWLAIAACAALILGVGFYAMQPRRVIHTMEGHPSTENQAILPADANADPALGYDDAPAPESYPMPAEAPNEDAVTDTGAFTLREYDAVVFPERAQDNDGQMTAFYLMPALNFVDATTSPEAAASIALPQGSFEVDLTLADLQTLFWGPDGKPDTLNPDTDLPWSLYWGGYTVWARAMYDGDGVLWLLTVHGERAGDTFTLTLSPGRMPPTCLVESWSGSVEFQGVTVSSRLREYDRNGDGMTDIICASEFLTDSYGCRFENMRVPQPEDETDNRESAIRFNTHFVRYALTGDGLYLGHIAQAELPAEVG